MRNIPVKEIDFKIMRLFNINTGEELLNINDIQELEITTDSQINYDTNPHRANYICKQDIKRSMNFTTNEPIDTKKFYELIGLDSSKMPDRYDIQFQNAVQARRHKKKRIDKKYLKRYGYKMITIESKGWKIEPNTDGTVRFIKKN